MRRGLCRSPLSPLLPAPGEARLGAERGAVFRGEAGLGAAAGAGRARVRPRRGRAAAEPRAVIVPRAGSRSPAAERARIALVAAGTNELRRYPLGNKTPAGARRWTPPLMSAPSLAVGPGCSRCGCLARALFIYLFFYSVLFSAGARGCPCPAGDRGA